MEWSASDQKNDEAPQTGAFQEAGVTDCWWSCAVGGVGCRDVWGRYLGEPLFGPSNRSGLTTKSRNPDAAIHSATLNGDHFPMIRWCGRCVAG
jgi:hypothetical protein